MEGVVEWKLHEWMLAGLPMPLFRALTCVALRMEGQAEALRQQEFVG